MFGEHIFLKIVWSQLEPSGGRAPKTTLTKAESRDGRCRDICLSHELPVKGSQSAHLVVLIRGFEMARSSLLSIIC